LIDKALLINLLEIKRAFNITAKDYTCYGVTNKSRNSCCFHSVTSGGDGVVDEGELALEL